MIFILFPLLLAVTSKELSDLSDMENIDDISGTPKENILNKIVLPHQEVRLECQKGNLGNISDDVQYSWLYQPTSHNSASNYLCGTIGLPSCTKRFVLTNVNKTSNGIYKCYLIKQKPGYIATSTLVTVIQLEVADQEVKPAKFTQGPESINVYESTPAFLSCQVESEMPLEIKWFKRDNYPEKGVNVIHYNNNTYRPLNNSITTRSKNIVKSVLSFDKVYKNDSGIYACSFISPNGEIKYEEGHINVHQTLVIFSSLVQDKWEIFAAAMIVFIIIITTVSCMIIICCRKFFQKDEDPTLNLMGKPDKSEDGNDTSDYEHVVL